MCIKILKLVILAEAMLGVHRNYFFLPKFGRILIWLRIVVEIALTACIVAFFQGYLTLAYQKEIIDFFLNVGSSFSIIILALYHCENFTKFMYYLEKSHAYFANDLVYQQRLAKTYKLLVFLIITYIIFKAGIVFYVNYTLVEIDVNILCLFVYTINISMCNLRYTFQFIVLYSILFLLSEHVKCITRRITEERKLNSIQNEEDEDDDNATDDVTHDVTSFDEWTMIYTNIKECSDLVNSIFGVQIIIILTALTFFFIMYLYSLTLFSVNGQLIPVELVVYNFKLAVFLVLLYALSRSAQTLQNSVEELRRRLGKLLIHSLSVSEEDTFKSTKDFLRLVSNRPIKTQAFGSITIDMTLVPKFVMFFTSYTVIALQFNNVV